ncbi:MAG: carboxypeptidase-like regulatory domain-containing protein [Anaerolineae bacterium]|nr:carboxypeptidase-like regulatory domain-containing protein [Anaerolineae bacterium]
MVEPTATPKPEGTAMPVANATNCQSVIEGYVVDGSGQRAQGATVMAEAEGWSGAIATDDQGEFGFAGLCAGLTTLQAFLPGGEATTAKTVDLTGQNSITVDLSAGMQPTDVPTSTATEQPGGQETTTAEVGMPLTGSSGWLLSGAILFGVLMLLTAGARRVLNVYEPSED